MDTIGQKFGEAKKENITNWKSHKELPLYLDLAKDGLKKSQIRFSSKYLFTNFSDEKFRSER